MWISFVDSRGCKNLVQSEYVLHVTQESITYKTGFDSPATDCGLMEGQYDNIVSQLMQTPKPYFDFTRVADAIASAIVAKYPPVNPPVTPNA